jgi:hypothetical protein
MKDLENRNPIIRLKKGVSGSGVDRWLKQLQVNDVTANHLRDAEALSSIIQLVTGINENALGQYSKGRRSAEQTKAVNSGAASRLKMQAGLVHAQSFGPLGEDLLSNLRDGLDEEQLIRVLGLQTIQPTTPYAVNANDFKQFLMISKADLVGTYDFDILDNTMSSEKGYFAQSLQEILMVLISNPQAAAIFGFDAKAIMQEIAELRGIRNPERFNLAPVQQSQMMQASQLTQDPNAQQGLVAPAASAALTNQGAGLPMSGAGGLPDISQLIGT